MSLTFRMETDTEVDWELYNFYANIYREKDYLYQVVQKKTCDHCSWRIVTFDDIDGHYLKLQQVRKKGKKRKKGGKKNDDSVD